MNLGEYPVNLSLYSNTNTDGIFFLFYFLFLVWKDPPCQTDFRTPPVSLPRLLRLLGLMGSRVRVSEGLMAD